MITRRNLFALAGTVAAAQAFPLLLGRAGPIVLDHWTHIVRHCEPCSVVLFSGDTLTIDVEPLSRHHTFVVARFNGGDLQPLWFNAQGFIRIGAAKTTKVEVWRHALDLT